MEFSSSEEVFRKLKQKKSNNTCADCLNTNLTYASVSHASLICSDCAEEHKLLGPNISYVKSLYDIWTPHQLKLMTIGGNQELKNFFENLKISSQASIEFKYSTVCAKYYRDTLKLSVEGKKNQTSPPSIDEAIVLITDPRGYGDTELLEEDIENNKKLGTIFNKALNTTIGIGKKVVEKAKDIDFELDLDEKAATALNTVNEGIKWTAEKGRGQIDKLQGFSIRENDIYKNIEEKTSFAINKVGEGIKWGAEVGQKNFERVKSLNVKDNEIYKNIEDKAGATISAIGKGIRKGAEMGRDHLGKVRDLSPNANELYRGIEDKASATLSKVSEGIRQSAEIGKNQFKKIKIMPRK